MSVILQKIRFLRVFHHSRSFTFMWSGQTFSSLGDGAFLTAQAWQVLLLTGSAAIMGVVLIAETIPLLLFLLIGGVVADRLPRKLVMICSDASRACVVLTIAALSWFHLLQIWHMICLSLIFGLVRGFFRPAYKSILAEIVQKQDLPSANALTDVGTQLRQLVGPMLGAACIALAGPAVAFAFDGLTFVASTFCLLMVYVPPRQDQHHLQTTTKSEIQKHYKRFGLKKVSLDIAEGLHYVVTSKWLCASIVIASIFNIGWMGPLFVALPKLVHDVYHTGAWLIGVLTMTSAIGSICASLVIAQMSGLRRRGLTAYLALVFPCTGLFIMGLPLPQSMAPLIASLAQGLIGLGLGVFNIIWATILQELVPNDRLGRVYSIDALCSFSLLPLGYALIGILTDAIGPTWIFIACGIGNSLLVAIGLSIREIRHMR